MSGVSEADDKPSDEILSLINYYACLQFTEEVRQYVAYSMLEQTETDRLQQIITNAEAGIPTLVGYFGSVSNTEERYGHAVVAYDVEYGPFQVNYIEEVDQMAMIKQQVMTAEFQYMTAIIIQTRIRISILITTVLGEQINVHRKTAETSTL